MKVRSTSVEYAKVFYLVCKEENILDEVLYDSKQLLKVNNELKKSLLLPVIAKDIRKDILDELQKVGMQKEVINLFKVLIDANSLHLFDEILAEFEELYQRENDILIVHATVASELTSQQKDDLCSKLEEKLGSFVVLLYDVKPAVIGGIKLEYRGNVINNTIAKHLAAFKKIY